MPAEKELIIYGEQTFGEIAYELGTAFSGNSAG
jgi:hypothetical protein